MSKSPYTTMPKIKKHNPRFFAPEAMEHYNSKVETGCLKGGYFITSEILKDAEETQARRYTVRRAVRANDGGKYYPFIENVGSFGEYSDLPEAFNGVFQHRELTTLKGRPLIEEMGLRVRKNGEPYGVSAFAEPTRGACLIVSTRPGGEKPLVQSLTFESVEEMGRVLAAGDNPMPATWIGTLIETVVMADEMMARALLSSGHVGLGDRPEPKPGT